MKLQRAVELEQGLDIHKMTYDSSVDGFSPDRDVFFEHQKNFYMDIQASLASTKKRILSHLENDEIAMH